MIDGDFSDVRMPSGLTFGQERAQREAREIAAENRARQLAGELPLDPVAAIGARAVRPILGDSRSLMQREIATEQALATQAVQHAVSPGSYLLLRDGRRLEAGAEVTLQDLDGSGAALRKLGHDGVLLSVDADTAFARSLPSNVQYAVFCDELVGLHGKVFKRGAAVKPTDFAPAPERKHFDDGARALSLVLRGIDPASGPPPMSAFEHALERRQIVRNPNYRAPAPTPTPKGRKQ